MSNKLFKDDTGLDILEQQKLIAEALTKLANKEDPSRFTGTLPASGWTNDSSDTTGYPEYYDLADATITSADLVFAIVDKSSQTTATECQLSPTVESGSGYIRFRAGKVPTAEIALSYWIDSKLS